FAADQKRISIEALTDGLKELNLRTDEFIYTKAGPAKEAFERLGYTTDELAEKLKKPEDLLTEIIGRLGDLDVAAQTRIADEIFGGTAAEQFVRFIDEGEEGLEAMRDRAHELGVVLSDEVGAAAGEVAKEFDQLMQRWDTWWKGSVIGTVQFFKDLQSDESAWEYNKFIGRTEEQGRSKLANMLSSGNLGDPLVEFFKPSKDYDAFYSSDAKVKPYTLDDLSAFMQSAIPGLPPERPKGLGAGKPRASSNRGPEISQYEKIIQALEHEARLIGQTQLEQDILNNIRRAGVDVMSDEAAHIREQITANDALTQAIEAQAAAQEELQRQIEGMTSVAMSHYDALIGGAESFGDAIIGTIEDIAQAWLRQQVQQGMNALFGGLMGGLSGGGGFPNLFGARANGGLIQPNQPYLVGERGPEIIVPGQQGAVIPNHRVANSGGGGSMSLSVYVDGATGNSEIHELVEAGVVAGLSQYDRGTDRRVAMSLKKIKLNRLT
ncbi:MAG: hypothetical protein ACJAZW_002493, partial [Maritalea sp.]